MNALTQRQSLWIPRFFIGAMGFVVAINMLLAWLAVSTWTGIETESHYRKGLAYNQNLEGAARQAELGWTVDTVLNATSGQSGPGLHTLSVRYTAKDGSALGGLNVRAHLIRPVHDGYDRRVDLQEVSTGQYSATLDVPLPGQWELRLVAMAADNTAHQWVKRIDLR